MTLSYRWLCEYLPVGPQLPAEWVEPEKLSRILTSVGLEVESMEPFESIRGGLKGLVTGEVISCEPHPDADRLKVTRVNTGGDAPLQIVCGAPNVARGQKVVVATVGSTIYPLSGEPLTMRKAKIRGVESEGMICAEDEIGIGGSHAGIMVLNDSVIPGTPAAAYFDVYTDWIYEIGLTPNRMDAMSHLGVARDVCAYLSHHHQTSIQVQVPAGEVALAAGGREQAPISVTIRDTEACQRYAGLCIEDVRVQESPVWLKNRLLSIGLRPINNIVDVTNFVLHETGQPLHAFDADAIGGQAVVVKKAEPGSTFITLDEKQRTLHGDDLMICNAQGEPMCIGGVFGGLHSGVTEKTTRIFLESAWFHPTVIRKTSFRHGLRTDAATRFEKGVDIGETVRVLLRAAQLIIETGGGKTSGPVVDVYPNPKPKKEVVLKYHFLNKLSGKNYPPASVRQILEALGFQCNGENQDGITVAVPYSKPDIALPADLVEEIMRIDGYDSVDIPSVISISPSADALGPEEALQDKAASYLVGQGFREMLTNSITNSKYYSDEVLSGSVRMLNNLSADLDILRPAMLETGLEIVVKNLNHRNQNLKLFEFGKTFHSAGVGSYSEKKQLLILVSGPHHAQHWQTPEQAPDIFFLRSLASNLLLQMGISGVSFAPAETSEVNGLKVEAEKRPLGMLGAVQPAKLLRFDIRQQVWMLQLDWEACLLLSLKQKITYRELPKYPSVERDLALVLDKQIAYNDVETAIKQAKLQKLSGIRLFDVFESDKLGAGKRSLGINLVFQDSEKTMTDAETDAIMKKLMAHLEKQLGAEIRK